MRDSERINDSLGQSLSLQLYHHGLVNHGHRLIFSSPCLVGESRKAQTFCQEIKSQWVSQNTALE